MTNIIVGLIILIIVGAAVAYLVRAKRKGVKCVGCPDSGCCSSSKKRKRKHQAVAVGATAVNRTYY